MTASAPASAKPPAKTPPSTPPKTREPAPESCNAVTLVGRVSAPPERRDLPSGDALVTLRLVVDRPPRKGSTKHLVDVIDVACWTRRTQRTAAGLVAGDTVRVEGALRRRFFAAGGGRASRYEVEVARLVRISRRPGPGRGSGSSPG